MLLEAKQVQMKLWSCENFPQKNISFRKTFFVLDVAVNLKMKLIQTHLGENQFSSMAPEHQQRGRV